MFVLYENVFFFFFFLKFLIIIERDLFIYYLFIDSNIIHS